MMEILLAGIVLVVYSTWMCALFTRIERKLDRIAAVGRTINRKEDSSMALGQVILEKVTAQTTLVASVKALVEGLVAQETIPADVAAQILATLDGNTAELEAALAAGVPPVPPTP